MATFSTLNNSWQQLYAKGNNLKLPERDVLTRDGVYFRKRPEPEVVEHMLDDIENKMRNYFILYNREREFRKKSEENCYRLEQELLNYKEKVEEATNKFHCLERKMRSMVDQPLKLKETIDRIDLLYNQMDTLIQAFVGIGSCAVIQGYSRVAFIKLCLEYLYPCRDLDIRLNTLYNALYNVLTQYDGIELTKNELLKPMTYHEPPEKSHLTGLSVKVHRLMLKCDLPNDDVKSFSCFFRYDNEPKELKEVEKSRYLTVSVKPMENATKVYEFNLLAENNKLPPKVPNVVPKLVLDVYADNLPVGSAEVSLISDKTLKPFEPWNVLDKNGVNCGDVVVTVIPVPQNAKLPASNFTNKTDELMRVTEAKEDKTKAEPLKPQHEPEQVVNNTVETVNKNSEKSKTFEPKVGPNVRRPLFNPKTSQVPRPSQNTPKPQQNRSTSNVSRVSMMFKGKNQSIENEQEKSKSVTEEVQAKDNEEKKDKSKVKELIIKKLSSTFESKDQLKESKEQPEQEKNKEEVKEEKEEPKVEPLKKQETNKESNDNSNFNSEQVLEKLESKANEPKKNEVEKPVEQNQPTKEQESKESDSNKEATKEDTPKLEKKLTKNLLPPRPPIKLLTKVPNLETVKDKNESGGTLPEKPLVPIVITPKLLKKPSPPKKN